MPAACFVGITVVQGALALAGWGVGGPVGGSLAAWIQGAVYGNVAAGSWFAAAQSIAMTVC